MRRPVASSHIVAIISESLGVSFEHVPASMTIECGRGFKVGTWWIGGRMSSTRAIPPQIRSPCHANDDKGAHRRRGRSACARPRAGTSFEANRSTQRVITSPAVAIVFACVLLMLLHLPRSTLSYWHPFFSLASYSTPG